MPRPAVQRAIPLVLREGECCLAGQMVHDVLAEYTAPETHDRVRDIVAAALRNPLDPYRKGLRTTLALLVISARDRVEDAINNAMETDEEGAEHGGTRDAA